MTKIENEVAKAKGKYYTPEFEEFRVKYLDREDIESFGVFHHDEDNCYHDKWGDRSLYYSDGTGTVRIVIKSKTVFQGVIKNKSELKRVLKQVGVIS